MDPETATIAAYWPLYWEPSTFSQDEPRVVLTRGFATWFRTSEGGRQLLRDVNWVAAASAAVGGTLPITFHYDDFKARCTWGDFPGALKNEPDDVLGCLGLALCLIQHEALVAAAAVAAMEGGRPGGRGGELGGGGGGPVVVKVQPRLVSVTPLTSIKDLKSGVVGQFVSVRGNVIRVSGVRPLVLSMNFVCTKCGNPVRAVFVDGKYDPPPTCSDKGCRSRTFVPDYRTATTVDWQKVRLQELDSDILDPGRVPRLLEVELTEDLVDVCVPGDVVTVGGVVKAIEPEVAAGRGGSKCKSLYQLYVDARSITAHKMREWTLTPGGGTTTTNAGHAAGKQFSEKDLAFIARVRGHRDVTSLLVASACPSIFGHEAVKLGMLLGLFSGTPRHVSTPAGMGLPGLAAPRDGGGGVGCDGASMLCTTPAHGATSTTGGPDLSGRAPCLTPSAMGPVAAGMSGENAPDTAFERTSSKLHVRCDPHILVVGDPGMGKSQMLRSISQLAPRGVYIGGNTTSTTGLTVTVKHDPMTGDYGLEAGALVLADQGVCCIDEFDKMGTEHQALLEAMEQQRISIAKAGIVSSLPARASVIAAANPAHGHYNKGKTITENLRLPPALLSRFDLIFLLVDKPDDLRDRQLSEHVMSMHDAHRRPAWLVGGGAGGGSGDGGGNAWAGDTPAPTGAPTALPPSTMVGLAGRGGPGPTPPGMDVFAASDAAVAAATQAAHERARMYADALERRRAAPPATFSILTTAAPITSGHTQGVHSSAAMVGSIAAHGVDGRGTLEVRLRQGVRAIQPAECLPQPLLRKYVAYARRYCFPALTPKAAAVLQEYYLQLRRSHGSVDTIPITTRQLESMIRLAEARAKLELREFVTVADANDVVELMNASLHDAITDDFGAMDFGRTSGMSMGKAVKAFVAAMSRHVARTGSNKFTTDELQGYIRDMRLQVPSVLDFLDVLNQQSYLIKLGSREWKLCVA